MSWCEFKNAAPELADFGNSRLTRKIAYLATIRAQGAPRVHPVSPFISDQGLFVYMEPTSPKAADLRRDPRFAMHCSVEDNDGGEGEFCVCGKATVIDGQARDKAFDAARVIGYKPNDRYVLFELGVDEVMATTYEDGVPVRRRWSRLQE